MFQSPDEKSDPTGNKRRVLVVDDEPTLRLGFAYALTNRVATVETAASGQQALEMTAGTRFDIMILDLRMPDLDGIGVIEALRGEGNPLPIVLCSAALHAGAALRAIRRGVVDFLLKPVRPDDLRQVIDFVLRPERSCYPQAMKAARSGQSGEAIRILESDAAPSRRAAAWLHTLISLRDGDSHLEQRLDASLPALAFNTPAI